MKSNRGFTLIELAVVLAIIAILAAILTPLVTQYVEEARVSRASEEARIIASGVSLHFRDTGRYPIYATFASASTDSDTLFGPGTAPTFGVSWSNPTSTLLQTRMNTNFFNLPTTPQGGRPSYRGPYSSGITADPWNFTYIVLVGPGPNAQALFVISAGPDGVIQTTKDQTQGGFASAGDDIVARIK